MCMGKILDNRQNCVYTAGVKEKYLTERPAMHVEETTLAMTMLLDFYGELLTEKQRRYFALYYNEDLSLSEIAENEGISRQSVWDSLRRSEATLREMEEKTGLIRRFQEQNKRIAEIQSALRTLAKRLPEDAGAQVQDIVEKLEALRQS